MAEHHHHKPSTSEFMDVDEVMVVPDTPDRVSRQPKNIRALDVSSRSSSVAGRVTMDRMNRRVGDGTCAAGMYSRGNLCVKTQSQGANGTTVPSSSFRNTAMSTMAVGKTFKHKDSYHNNNQHIDDDKVSHSGFSGKSSHHHIRSEDPILVEHGEIAKSSKSTKDGLGAQKMNKGYLLPTIMGSLHTVGDSSESTSKDKGKVKVVYDKNIHWDTRSVKQNDSIWPITSDRDTGKDLSPSPLNFRVSSTTTKKKLVRNGFISPMNIEKNRRFEETFGNGSENTECAEVSNGAHPVIDANEATAGNNAACRAKGKGLLVHDSSSKGHASRRSDFDHFDDGECKGKYPENDHVLIQDTGSNSNKVVMGKHTSLFHSTSFEQKLVPSEDQLHTPKSSIKRQRKHGLSSGSQRKNTEVICLSSGGESSTVRSARSRGDFPHRELGSPLAIGEISPEIRESSISQTDNDSNAMALQLEADEMLARELQEQLYNEIPESTSGEQGDSLQLASSRRNHQAHRFVAPSPPNRVQSSQPQSLRNRLFRGARARGPRSNIPRLRSHAHHHARRDRLFPSNMDLDMRIDLLETLEAVVSDDIRMVNQLLDADREFGENDYEMLLALDENNHTHLGASVVQIANLPESTVNIDDSEACSICLETPAMGDTMRHLPCLHKFHKDCIDPWLRRKRSCPVCKSDI